MRNLLVAMLLGACAPHVWWKAHTSSAHAYGERWVTILAPDQDADALTRMLEPRGFRIARTLPWGAEKGEPITPYIISVDGTCGAWGFVPANLRVQVFEREHRELVFEGQITDRDGCPDAFYREVVVALDGAWRAAE